MPIQSEVWYPGTCWLILVAPDKIWSNGLTANWTQTQATKIWSNGLNAYWTQTKATKIWSNGVAVDTFLLFSFSAGGGHWTCEASQQDKVCNAGRWQQKQMLWQL